jgi:tetratricopeptide (TPR) repeat protein
MLKRLSERLLRRASPVARPAAGESEDLLQDYLYIDSALQGGDLAAAGSRLEALPVAAYAKAATHNLAGRLHLARGEAGAASACFEITLALDPKDLYALCALADLRMRAGYPGAAADLYARAAQLDSSAPGLQYNFALALAEAGRPEEALEHALLSRADGGNLEACMLLLGRLHEDAGRWPAAQELYQEACQSFPASAAAWAGRGRAARARADYAQAEQAFARAHDLTPDAGFGLDIGLAQYHQHDYGRACATLEACLASRPDWPEAGFSLANARLAQGDFERGWIDYRQRLRIPGRKWTEPAGKPWSGQRYDGATLIVDAEQGFGDAFMAVRFLRPASMRGGRLVFRGPRAVLPVLAASELADALLPAEDPVRADWHCYLMDLPGLLGVHGIDALGEEPYLRAPAAAAETWKRRLAGAGLKVGLVWSGLATAPQNRYRMFDPAHLIRELGALPHVRLFGLQLPGRGIAPCPSGVEDLSGALADFGETAGVLANLDLLIAADTSTAHLAGGMGVPVWIPLSAAADWRWRICDRENPWYPSARLFRQSAPMQWGEVFASIAAELSSISQANGLCP